MRGPKKIFNQAPSTIPYDPSQHPVFAAEIDNINKDFTKDDFKKLAKDYISEMEVGTYTTYKDKNNMCFIRTKNVDKLIDFYTRYNKSLINEVPMYITLYKKGAKMSIDDINSYRYKYKSNYRRNYNSYNKNKYYYNNNKNYKKYIEKEVSDNINRDEIQIFDHKLLLDKRVLKCKDDFLIDNSIKLNIDAKPFKPKFLAKVNIMKSYNEMKEITNKSNNKNVNNRLNDTIKKLIEINRDKIISNSDLPVGDPSIMSNIKSNKDTIYKHQPKNLFFTDDDFKSPTLMPPLAKDKNGNIIPPKPEEVDQNIKRIEMGFPKETKAFGKTYYDVFTMKYFYYDLYMYNTLAEQKLKQSPYIIQTPLNNIKIEDNKFNITYYMPNFYIHKGDINSELNTCLRNTFLKIIHIYNPEIIYQLKGMNLLGIKLNRKIVRDDKTIDQVYYKYFSYSKYVNSKILESKCPVGELAYNFYTKQGYKIFEKKESPNKHDDPFASLRRGEERLLMEYIQKNFSGYIRYSGGDNLDRVQHVGGIYFLHDVDGFDKLRIMKYKSGSCVSDQNIIDDHIKPQHFWCEEENSILTFTDVHYYIENMKYLYEPINNTNDEIDRVNNNRKYLKQIFSIFHIYTSKKGTYKSGVLNVTVYYNRIKIKRNGKFTIIEENVNAESYDNIINFNDQNKIYVIPYVYVTLDDNSFEYRHPFPIIYDRVISLEDINKTYKCRNNITVSLLRMAPITDFDFYITIQMTYHSETSSGIYLNYGDIQPIIRKEDESLSEIITINKIDTDLLTMFDINKYQVASNNMYDNIYYTKDNYAIINQSLYEIDYKFSEIKGDYIEIQKRGVKRSIPIAYLNTCVNCYRRMEITSNSIASAKNIILRTAESEKWVPQVDINRATDYALIAAYIVQKINIVIDLNYKKLNEARERTLQELDKKEKIIAIKSNVKRGFNLFENVIDSPITNSFAELIDSEVNKNIVEQSKKTKFYRFLYPFIFIHMFISKLYYKILLFLTTWTFLYDEDEIKENKKYYTKIINTIINWDKPVSFMKRTLNKLKYYRDKIKNVSKKNVPKQLIKKFFYNIKRNIKIYNRMNSLKEQMSYMFYKFPILKTFVIIYLFLFLVIIFGSIIIFIGYTYDTIYFYFIKTCIHWLFGSPHANLIGLLIILKHLIIMIYMGYLISRGSKISKRQLLLMTLINIAKGPTWKIAHSVFRNILGISLNLVLNIVVLYYIIRGNKRIFLLYVLTLLPKTICSDVYTTSICSPNDTLSMYNFLVILEKLSNHKKDLTEQDKEILKSKYSKDSIGKYGIYKIPKPDEFHCDFNAENDVEPLSNIAPQINGHIITENWPLKIHKCPLDECEAVYRQVQSSIFYDKKIAKMYIRYSQKWIKNMVDDFFSENNSYIISLTEYFVKLGGKRKEYIEAWEEYCSGKPLDFCYNMHPKSDEKIVINWKKLKAKSRNISAQKSMCKLLMGMVCEVGMSILHKQPWAGPGENYINKASKFLDWIDTISPSSGVLCCDGSAFDSTQHKLFIDNIDSYFLKYIFQNCFHLDKYFNLQDIYNIIEQSEFRIYSKYFAFKMLGTQLSGRMNTCLCNTLRSATYIKFIVSRMELIVHKKLDFVSVFYEVTGDDQIIFVEHIYKELYVRIAYEYVYYKEDININHGLGQVCKIFDFYPDVTGAEYLSCIILYNATKHKLTLMRKPDRFLQLIPFTFRNKHRNVIKYNILKEVLCYEVGLSVCISCKNIPLYYAIGKKMMELGKPMSYLTHCNNLKIIHNKSYKSALEKIKKIKQEMSYKIFSAESDCYVYKEEFEDFMLNQYNITKEDIDEVIDKYSKLTNINDEIHVDLIDKIYDVTSKEYLDTYLNINRNGDYTIRTIDKGKYNYEVICKYKNVVNEHIL